MLRIHHSTQLAERLLSQGKHQEIEIRPTSNPREAGITITGIEVENLERGGLEFRLYSNGVLIGTFDPVHIAPGGKLVVDIAKCPYSHIINLS